MKSFLEMAVPNPINLLVAIIAAPLYFWLVWTIFKKTENASYKPTLDLCIWLCRKRGVPLLGAIVVAISHILTIYFVAHYGWQLMPYIMTGFNDLLASAKGFDNTTLSILPTVVFLGWLFVIALLATSLKENTLNAYRRLKTFGFVKGG